MSQVVAQVRWFMKDNLQGVSRKFYKLVKPFRFSLAQNRHVPVLVYQMGKVASTSVYVSLRRVYPGLVLHAHSFMGRHQDAQMRSLYKRTIFDHRPLNAIVLIREPIGRNVAAFFENFERFTGVKYSQSHLSLMELKDIFLNKYPHWLPLGWFDYHINVNLGIDVYDRPFPEHGFVTFGLENIRLLVMRCEMDDALKISAIKEFLGLSDFELCNQNVGSQKEYAELYKRFKAEVRLPAWYVTMMCESRYFKHFYSSALIESVRQKWSE